jgi:hypothetical protein
MATQRLAEATKAGESLGEPGGYATAGAPAPIGVIRGMKQTYAVDAGGPQLSEFAQPEQAKMAWHRNQADVEKAAADTRGLTDPGIAARHGTWTPSGTALATITANKEGPGQREERLQKSEVFKTAKAKEEENLRIAKQKQDEADFDRHLNASRHATFEPEKGSSFIPKTRAADLDRLASRNYAREFGWKAGLEHMDERQLARQYLAAESLRNPNWPENFDVDAYLDQKSKDPERWKNLISNAKTHAISAGGKSRAIRQELPVYELPAG